MTKSDYKKSGEDAKEIQTHLNDLVRKAWKELIEEKPELESKYSVQALNVCYHKRPAGSWRIIPKITEHLLRKGNAEKKNKEILEAVRKDLPKQIIHDTIWSRELKQKELKRVKTIIKGTMQTPLDITGCKTLSQIKKRLIAFNREKKGVYTFKPTITIDKDMLMINGDKVLPIIRKKTGNYEYPGAWVDVRGKRAFLRVDALIAMLID